uniref:uncharacterized protein LOC120953078 isoform X3 n=1 Tax=Anopheles coluzzii TaxID=1518534 RepID=UPI0020FFEB2E|nr:uncharacterized protein LOC120953078 isoform X3 [Anopheles coluzzii]
MWGRKRPHLFANDGNNFLSPTAPSPAITSRTRFWCVFCALLFSFSVNFCLPRPAQVAEHQTPPYIALHFKTIYDERDDTSRVVLNWKNLQWQQEEVLDNYWHVDRSQTFRVVFRLHEDCIKVFVNSVDHPPDYQFPVQLPLDQIESIELWDDVEHVEEISFRLLTR